MLVCLKGDFVNVKSYLGSLQCVKHWQVKSSKQDHTFTLLSGSPQDPMTLTPYSADSCCIREIITELRAR